MPGSTEHCICGISLPKTLVKTLAKNLVKNVTKNLDKTLTNNSLGKLTEN